MRVVMLTAADVRRYRDLMLEAYAQAPDAFTSTPQERAAQPESWWIGRIANPAGWTAAVGAFDGDELVGAVALEFSAKPKTRHKALLIGMYVAPAARGQGIGRRLMQAIETRFNNVQRYELFTGHLSSKNLALYEKLGYREFSRKTQSEKVVLIRMEKKLEERYG